MTFDAHLDGEAKAYVNGWIDFNNNGKFDEDEAAGVTEVTADGKVTLTWTNTVQNVDTSATKLATRLRIAYDKADVKAPTGIAYSGEVEDFQIQQQFHHVELREKQQMYKVLLNIYCSIQRICQRL